MNKRTQNTIHSEEMNEILGKTPAKLYIITTLAVILAMVILYNVLFLFQVEVSSVFRCVIKQHENYTKLEINGEHESLGKILNDKSLIYLKIKGGKAIKLPQKHYKLVGNHVYFSAKISDAITDTIGLNATLTIVNQKPLFRQKLGL